MWTPPERIRHALPPARWPSAVEAAQARWFSPVALGPVTAAQRTWVPAMVPWRASESGEVTPEVLDWYGRFAEGRPGVLVVEATGIRDVPSGPLLRIGHDRFLPGLRRLVEVVRERSEGQTRLFVQLIDFLRIARRPTPATYFARYLVVTPRHREALARQLGDEGYLTAPEAAVRQALARLDDAAALLDAREREALLFGYRERVSDLHLPPVRELPRVLPPLFAAAAERAFAAGFDGVELHYAHAYTMASFLSATNRRDDGYGGTREERVRLPREVLAAVRARVGDRCVGARLLSDEAIVGGSGLDDARYFAVELAGAGLDFISLSVGGKFDDAAQPKVGQAAYPYTGPSGYACMPTFISDARGPFGRNVGLGAAVREAVRQAGLTTPIVVAGGICDFDQAEGILARGEADLVAAARQTLADPDWFEKIRLGQGATVRRCQYTNYCEALDQRHQQVTCKLWDRQALDEPGVKLDARGHRRLTAPRWTRPDQGG